MSMVLSLMVLSALKPNDSTSTLTVIFLFLANSLHGLLSLSVKLLTPAHLLVLGVLMFYFVYQILFILKFLSSTSVPKAAAEPCDTVQCTAYTPKGQLGMDRAHSLVTHLFSCCWELSFQCSSYLVSTSPSLCMQEHCSLFLKRTRRKKKIHNQATTNVLVHCYNLLPQLTFIQQ